MRLPFAMPSHPVRPEHEHAPDTRLRGRWLLAARAAWLAVMLLAVIVCAATVPVEFARLQQICSSDECVHPHLTPTSLAELQAMGLSVHAFATYFIVAAIMFASVWFGAGALIFWLKSDDRVALLVSLFLATFGLSFTIDPRILSDAYPAWQLPSALFGFVGASSVFLFFCVFPDGRFVPGWLRWLAAIWVVQQAPSFFLPNSALNSDHWPGPAALIVNLALFGTLVAAQIYRYRRVSSQLQRQQAGQCPAA